MKIEIDVPDSIYERLELDAEVTRHSIEQEVILAVEFAHSEQPMASTILARAIQQAMLQEAEDMWKPQPTYDISATVAPAEQVSQRPEVIEAMKKWLARELLLESPR